MTYYPCELIVKEKLLIPLLVVPLLISCQTLLGQPESPPSPAQKVAAARQLFWDTMGGDQYERLPEVKKALQEVYEQDPMNPENTLLLGSAYMWSLSEWERIPSRGLEAKIQEASTAERYLAEAHKLLPGHSILLCLLGGTRIHLGALKQSPELMGAGDALVQQCIARYPQFGLFVRALNGCWRAPSDPLFRPSVDALWEDMDSCIDEKLDRQDPDFTRYLALEWIEGPKRACWNTPKAPHNLDGFWLFMGDMEVKSGNVDVGVKLYKNAMLNKSFSGWRYRDLLAQRIEQAPARAALYQDSDPANDPPVAGMQSFQCTMCHAR